jgi:hypothetical protein
MKPRIIISLVTAGIFVVLIVVTYFSSRYKTKETTGILIAQDIARLSEIFQRIHEQCKILSFDYQKNPINFLNNISFVSSEVGPMNLANPEGWKGQYVDDNPTIQGKEYQIVRTKQGYFITPGEGVWLPNGKVIGKDIMLDENTDIPALMRDKNGLQFEGKALAAPLPLTPLASPLLEIEGE